MFRIYYFVFLLSGILFSNVGHSQGIKISGLVTDEETKEPLPNAHIFIDQTTIGVVSNYSGYYILEGIQDGEIKIVFSFVGYEPLSKMITVSGADMSISVQLKPLKEILQNVDVKDSRDKQWETQLRQFKKMFFGEDEFAEDCDISNPWVLEFTYTKSDKTFKAEASAPLSIENKGLGYAIECTLQEFSFNQVGYKIRGLYRFNEINTLDKKEAMLWTRNRKKAYQSSIRFLLKSIVENNIAENGFQLYYDKREELPKTNLGYFGDDLGNTVIKANMRASTTPSGRPGVYRIAMDDRLEIHHTTLFTDIKTYRDVSSPVSWIECDMGALFVTKEGYLINFDQIVTSGELNKNRIASMLPLNYNPGNVVIVNYLTKQKIAKRLQEKVYLHTDKEFYYPGEQLWYKAYMNYANQSVRDSLSTVLYVDIITPQKQIVDSKMLNLKNSVAKGNIHLSEKLSPGLYYIRAYTSWMKNYGDESLFYSPFVVMDTKQKLKINNIKEEKGDFKFSTRSTAAFQNDSIRLSITLDSTLDHYLANCSVTIIPIGQSRLPNSPSLKESLSFQNEILENTYGEFVYPLEYNFSIRGILTKPKKQFTSGVMNVIQGEMDSVYQFKTDSKGKFKITGLEFYDTVKFAFQARDKKNRIFGTTTLVPRHVPVVKVPALSLRNFILDTLTLESPVTFSVPSTTDTLFDRKTNAAIKPVGRTNIGAYDYLITKEEIETIQGNQNVLFTLQHKIHGFQIHQSSRSLSFQQGLSENSINKEPLIVIDGLPMNNQIMTSNSTAQRQNQKQITSNENQSHSNASDKGQTTVSTPPQSRPPATEIQTFNSASEILSNISIHDVNQIEVSTKFDPRYGSSGANGVISIHMSHSNTKRGIQKTFDEFTIEGYTQASSFVPLSPEEHLSQEYSPTIYWNPSIDISAKKETIISFRSVQYSDQYILEIKGISNEGKPVEGTVQVKVQYKK